MVRASAGDHAAFSELAASASGGLYRVAYLILRDTEDANDAVQNALFAAWRDIRGLRDPDRFDAWLRRLFEPGSMPRRQLGNRTASSNRPFHGPVVCGPGRPGWPAWWARRTLARSGRSDGPFLLPWRLRLSRSLRWWASSW